MRSDYTKQTERGMRDRDAETADWFAQWLLSHGKITIADHKVAEVALAEGALPQAVGFALISHLHQQAIGMPKQWLDTTIYRQGLRIECYLDDRVAEVTQ